MDKQEIQWRQYQLNVEMYKNYLELVLKLNGFYYAVTGAILSYYFAHRGDTPLMRWSLIVPLVISIFLAILFGLGAWAAKVQRKEVFDLRDALGLDAAPELAFLILLLILSLLLMLLVAVGIAAVFLHF